MKVMNIIEHRRSFLFILVIVSTILAAIYYIRTTGPYFIPNIKLDTIYNESLDLGSIHNKPILITFWSPTCTQCLSEIPDLITLYNEFSPNELIIVSIIIYYGDINLAKEMVESTGIPYIVATDSNKVASYSFGGIHTTPTTFLASPTGRILYRKKGRSNYTKVKKMIATLVNE